MENQANNGPISPLIAAYLSIFCCSSFFLAMVKFGKYLLENRVAEWADYYVRYKMMKKILKKLAAGAVDQEEDSEQEEEREKIRPLSSKRPRLPNPQHTLDLLRAAAHPEEFPDPLDSPMARPQSPPESLEFARLASRGSSVGLKTIDPMTANQARRSLEALKLPEAAALQAGNSEPIELLPLSSDNSPERSGDSPPHTFSADFQSFLAHLPVTLQSSEPELAFFTSFFHDFQLIQSFYAKQEEFFLQKVDLLSKQVFALYKQRTAENPGKLESPSTTTTGVPGFSNSSKRRHNAYVKNKSLLHKSIKELYRGLMLLKNYRILNYTGFIKILKKHDKLTPFAAHAVSSQALTPVIRHSQFYYSPVLDQCIARAENIFISFFHHGDRKKAMEILRVSPPPISYWALFRLGVAIGLIACLFLVFICFTQFSTEISFQTPAVTVALPIFRLFSFVLLIVWLWAALISQYEKHHLNFGFILELDTKTQLSYIAVLEVAAIGTVLYGISVNLFCLWLVLPNAPFSPHYWHFFLFLTGVFIFFFPRRFFHSSTRIYFLSTCMRIFAAPFYPVGFKELFLADQFCSWIPVIYDSLYTALFYFNGYFLLSASSGGILQNSPLTTQFVLNWIFACLPYLWRFLQCLRRFYETRQTRQAMNALKYTLSILTLVFSYLRLSTPNESTANTIFYALWAVLATSSSIYNFLWDIRMDWGFLQPHARHRFLRNHLSLHNPLFYYFAVVLNAFFRIVWIFSLSPSVSIYTGSFTPDLQRWFVGGCEIFRRAVWNYIRLENEHISNVEGFRVVNIVPLAMKMSGEGEDFHSPNAQNASGQSGGSPGRDGFVGVAIGPPESRDLAADLALVAAAEEERLKKLDYETSMMKLAEDSLKREDADSASESEMKEEEFEETMKIRRRSVKKNPRGLAKGRKIPSVAPNNLDNLSGDSQWADSADFKQPEECSSETENRSEEKTLAVFIPTESGGLLTSPMATPTSALPVSPLKAPAVLSRPPSSQLRQRVKVQNFSPGRVVRTDSAEEVENLPDPLYYMPENSGESAAPAIQNPQQYRLPEHFLHELSLGMSRILDPQAHDYRQELSGSPDPQEPSWSQQLESDERQLHKVASASSPSGYRNLQDANRLYDTYEAPPSQSRRPSLNEKSPDSKKFSSFS